MRRGLSMPSLNARLDRLEQREGRKWPFLQVFQDGTTDAEAEAELEAEVRAAGWAGPLDDYPGGFRIVEIVRVGSWEGVTDG